MEKLMGNVISMEKTVGYVYVTTDYSLFKRLRGNRDINKANYKKIKQSMAEKQLQIPIIVNENYEIIDGQHRFTSCQELGLPVYYIVVAGYTVDDIKRANVSSKAWKKEDYLNLYIEEGNENYIIFNNLMEEQNISLDMLLKLFMQLQGKKQAQIYYEFEHGELTLDGIEGVNKFMQHLELFNSFVGYKTSSFIIAFRKLYFKADYSHDYMVKKYKAYGQNLNNDNVSLLGGATTKTYLKILCNDIYSAGRTEKPIYYDVAADRFYN